MPLLKVNEDSESLVSESKKAFDEAAALHRAGKFADAEVLLRDAITLDPTNVSLRNARGVMFAGMNRHLDAVWCCVMPLPVTAPRWGFGPI